MIPVTIVTANATQDPVTPDLYRQILADLRAQGMTYRQLADALGFSAAMWRFWERGERPLSREAMQALREFTDEFPAMPPTVAEVVAGMVHPDATVYMVGDLPTGDLVRRVLLLAQGGKVSVSANGTITAMAGHEAVTPVTQPRPMDRRHRLTVSKANYEWLRTAGISADQAIERMKENEQSE